MPRKKDQAAAHRTRVAAEKAREAARKATAERRENQRTDLELSDDIRKSLIKSHARRLREVGANAKEIAGMMKLSSSRTASRILEMDDTSKIGRPTDLDRPDIQNFIRIHRNTYPTKKALQKAVEAAFEGVKLNYKSFCRWLNA